MPFSSGLILGYSSATCYATDGKRVFTPSAGSIVVTSENCESIKWEPTDGLYDINDIAINRDGIICFAEKRLSVSLHFFTSDMRHIHEAEGVASVEVQQIAFSADGNTLFVLCNYPTSCVKVLRAPRKGVFSVQQTVTLPDVEHQSVMYAPFSDSGCDFLVTCGSSMTAFAFQNGKYVDCFSITSDHGELICAAATGKGVVFGTASGNLCLYDLIERSQHVIASFDNSITSLDASREFILVGTSDNKLQKMVTDGDEVLSTLCTLPSPALRITVGKKVAQDVILGTEVGIYRFAIPYDDGILFPFRRRIPQTVNCHAIGVGGDVVIISVDGSFCYISGGKVNQWKLQSDETVTDSCVIGSCIVVLLKSGEIVYVDCVNGSEIDRKQFTGISSSLKCESNKSGSVIVYDEKNLYFFLATAAEITLCGYFPIENLETSPAITTVRCLPQDGLFLAVCSNGEVYQLKALNVPHQKDTQFMPEAAIKGMWRLDLPVVDIFPCYVGEEVINVLVHSVDKETKLYALDRRRERDGKTLRPLFLMRDHENGGSCFHPFNETTVCSAGKDGKIILRDVSPYQSRLSTIPPSKEKRKPTFEVAAWHFCNGGITSLCAAKDLLICVGRDAVVKFLPCSTSHEQVRWPEPLWLSRRMSNAQRTPNDSGTGLGLTAEEREQLSNSVVATLSTLRDEWLQLLSSNDIEVPVETFLLPEDRLSFQAECDDAIVEMKNHEYYHLLENEHTQDLLKERCCNTMEVNRTKVVSIQEKGVEVHNFHVRKSARDEQSLARKAAFLRNLQSAAGSGKQFSSRGEGRLECSKLCSDGVAASLFPPHNVYTSGRATLQTLLLKGLILEVKDAFNERYVAVLRKKSRLVSLIEERNSRCLQIMKQLGETPVEMFSILVDPEEDPSTLFEVEDEELPESVRSLIPKKEADVVYSASNEAALKLWMDGLEKDVELLQVDMPPPDFADDSLDVYVPPDERSEEQVALFEEYEKKLAEATDAMNTRKDGLRSEFKALQKENKRSADELDADLRELRALRLTTAAMVDQAELESIMILQNKLKTLDAHKAHLRYQEIGNMYERKKQQIEVLLKLGVFELSDTGCGVEPLKDALDKYLVESRHSEPFNSALHGEKLYRRFMRWRKRAESEPKPPSAIPPDDVPADDWEKFREHCKEVIVLLEEIEKSVASQREQMRILEKMNVERDRYADLVADCEEQKRKLVSGFFTSLLNTGRLYKLQQGQVQDEKVAMASDLATSSLRWVSDIDQYNQLILSSAGESSKIQEKIAQRQKTMKLLQFEKKRTAYCIGTLQLDLRQLHTLRVTRLMQEWLSGDADISEEKALAKMDDHIQFIESKMQKKIKDLSAVSAKMKGRIAERATENTIIQQESTKLGSTVYDARRVKDLVDSHTHNSYNASKRARDIYVTSELEELARSQQEELLRLKEEVDRQRERTFPSFAVVAKRR